MVAPQLHHGHEHCCRHSGCDDDGDGDDEQTFSCPVSLITWQPLEWNC